MNTYTFIRKWKVNTTTLAHMIGMEPKRLRATMDVKSFKTFLTKEQEGSIIEIFKKMREDLNHIIK